jgi:alkylation response protein AidB-like acyl-CoA dehydrogenase
MQRRLTDLRLRVDLSRALARDTLARAVAGQRYYAEASQLKMWMARQLMEASLESAQVMGSYGVQRNQGLHRAALDGLCVTIAGGTEEAHRMFLFNDMVNQRRESEAVKQRRKDEETLRFRQNGAGTE